MPALLHTLLEERLNLANINFILHQA